MTGKVSEDQYGEISSDAEIVKTFTKEELEAAKGEDGYYTLTFTEDAENNCYYRLRGTTVSEVDENGDPLPDPDYSGITDNITRFDTINDYNYSSMCFYANPIWVNVSEKTAALDTQILENALELAAEADTEGVIPAVAERFGKIYSNAQSILQRAQAGDAEITQAMVDQSWQELIRIMQYLSFKQGDKTNLEKVIEMADSIDLDQYLSDGKDEFTAALDAAHAVMDNADAMQDEVDAGWKELLKAMSSLRLKPSKELLEALIQTAEGMSLENTDPGTAAAFSAALEGAKAVYEDAEADAEEVSSAVESLQSALAAVEENQMNQGSGDGQNSGSSQNSGSGQGAESGQAGQNSGDSQNGKTAQPGAKDASGSNTTGAQKAVRTGDSGVFLFWIGCAGISAALTLIYSRKRKMW